MTASNHVITGAIIGATVAHPLIALPLALASHLLLDALPHYGNDSLSKRSRRYLQILGGDICFASIVLLLIFIAQPSHWLLMLGCAVVAASPDLLWLPQWLAFLQHKKIHKTKLDEFLSWIQWAELPWGWVFELAWLAGALPLLFWALTR